jgi:hypothetical protein
MDVAKAVDSILQGKGYEAEERLMCLDGEAVALLMEELTC